MTIENDHLFLVNDDAKSYKIKYGKIKKDITDDVKEDITAFPEADEDGKQYGRQDGEWTEIVHTPEYTDADVNDLLNTTSNSAGKILGYNGNEYVWVQDQNSGDGGGGSWGGPADKVTYTHPGGSARNVQDRLQDRTSVLDFYDKDVHGNDHTICIQAAVDWVGKNGGGTVYFPAGNYNVKITKKYGHRPLDENDTVKHDPESPDWKLCAVTVPYDNVHLVGAGQGATVIKATDANPTDDACYGIFQVAKTPILNAGEAGHKPVFGGSVRDMTLDNNTMTDTALKGGTLLVRGIQDYTVQNVTIKRSGFYGVSMQKGGFRNVTFQNMILQDITRDGIDMKDNGNKTFGVQFDNITCRRVCKRKVRDSAGEPIESAQACLDVQGYGLQFNNIIIEDIGNEGNCGIRVKQSGKSGARGNPGRRCSINNVYLQTDKKLQAGVLIKAGGVSLSNVKLLAKAEDALVLIEQPNCSLINCYLQNADKGVLLKAAPTVNGDVDPNDYPAGDGGDFTVIQSCVFRNMTTGVDCNRANCNISNNIFDKLSIGIDLTSSTQGDTDGAVVMGNQFTKAVSNDIAYNKNNQQFILNNVNHVSPSIVVENNTTQGPMMTFVAADGDEILKIGRGIGFHGADPKRKQSIGGNVATDLDDVVKDLVKELDEIGLIKNDTINIPGNNQKGVTSIKAGSGISVNQSTGDVTITATGNSGAFDPNGMLKTSGNGIGFYGTSPVSKRETKGRLYGGNLSQTQKTLLDLIKNLEQIGLITNGTTNDPIS